MPTLKGGRTKSLKKLWMPRGGKIPQLTPEEKEVWDRFAYHQWKRSPDFYEKIATLEDFEASLQRTIVRFEETHRPLTPEERTTITSPEAKARLMQNALAGALLNPGDIAVGAIGSRGLGIARTKHGNKSFIVGSFPIVKFTHRETPNLLHPTTELWLPISFDVAVSPAGPRGTERLVVMTDDRHLRCNQHGHCKAKHRYRCPIKRLPVDFVAIRIQPVRDGSYLGLARDSTSLFDTSLRVSRRDDK